MQIGEMMRTHDEVDSSRMKKAHVAKKQEEIQYCRAFRDQKRRLKRQKKQQRQGEAQGYPCDHKEQHRSLAERRSEQERIPGCRPLCAQVARAWMRDAPLKSPRKEKQGNSEKKKRDKKKQKATEAIDQM